MTEIVEDAECNSSNNGWNENVLDQGSIVMNTGNATASSGTGGSMARFSIIDKQLYVVDNRKISVFNVDGGMNKTSYTYVSREVETLFGMEDYLFLGTTTGMIVYNRNDGGEPTYVSSFNHARGCDPVIVDGNYAFVTVTGNGACGQADDELHVIDITNIESPELKASHAMYSPFGLGYNGNTLMLCDGKAGLKVFDKSDIYKIGEKQLDIDNSVNAYDVIVLDDYLILTSEEGIFQYSYTDQGRLTKLSNIYAK